MARQFHKKEEKIEPIEKVYRPLSKMLRDNFLGGISWALGATVGLAVIVGLVTFILNLLGGLPIVGGFFADIVESTNQALDSKR